MASIKVFGLQSLSLKLRELPKKLANKVVRKALREGAKVVADEVRKNAPVETGLLRASVKIKAGKRRKGQVAVIVTVTGGHKDAIIGFVEYGRRGQTANPFIRRSFAAKQGEVAHLITGKVAIALAAMGV